MLDLACPARNSQQVLVKPPNSLVKGLLLGPPLDPDGEVATHRKAVLDAAEKVDLVRLADLLQNLLGLVALFGWEDLVRLRGGDGQGAGDGSELVLIDKGRVSDVADLDAVLVVADDVLEEGYDCQHAGKVSGSKQT